MEKNDNNILRDVLRIKTYYVPVLILISLGLVYLLPQNTVAFLIVSAVLIALTLDKPLSVLYITTGIITFRYYFVNSNVMEFTGLPPSDIFFRFRLIGDFFVANVHNFVYIYLVLVIIKNSPKIKTPSGLNKKIVVAFIFLAFIIAVLGLANESGFFTSVLLFVQYTRPALFFLIIFTIDWDVKRMYKFILYVVVLIFSLQFILTYADNIKYLLQGYIFLGDNFTGSFTFPFNWVMTQILFYALCIFISFYFYTRSKLSILYIAIILFSLASTQTGFQTGVDIVLLLPFFIYLAKNSPKLGLGRFKNTFLFASLFLGTFVLFLVLQSLVNLPGYDYIFGYTEDVMKRFNEVGILEYPKFKFYEFFFDLIIKGDINIITGLGPGNFMSGAGVGASKYFKLFISNTMLFKGLMSNTGYFVQNTFVGVLGELGIFGTFFLYYIYVVPFRYLTKNITYYQDTFLNAISVGTVGIFFVIIGFSFLWNIFEDFAMPIYYFIIIGLLVVFKEQNLKQKSE